MQSIVAGLRLEDRYVLLDKIGEGGMGVVWLAVDERLGRNVAIKLLHATLVGDESAAERLRQEAKAASRIEHRSVCKVLTVGEHEGVPFLVMELLSGKSLAELLKSERVLGQVRAVQLLVEVLAGVAAAHREGVIHRDLKAENIFVLDDGSIRILDFGVARFLHERDRVRLTVTGALVGTPAYMSPEQARGEAADERADLWSCGVLLYELVCGALPYDASSFQAMLVAIATQSHMPARQRRRQLQRELSAIIERSLNRTIRGRFQSANEFSEALTRWLDDHQKDESVTLIDAATASLPSTSPNPPLLTLHRTRERVLLTRVAPFFIAALIVAVGTLLIKSAHRLEHRTARTAPLNATMADGFALGDASASLGQPVDGSRDGAPSSRQSPVGLPDASNDAASTVRSVRGGRRSRRDGGAGIGITPDPDF